MLKHTLAIGSLYLASTLFAQEQAKLNYPVCGIVGSLLIGEVPGWPFTARVVEVAQQISQNGVGLSYGAPENQVGFVVRDREGRVSAKWRQAGFVGLQTDDPHYRQMILCDPGAGKNVLVDYLSTEENPTEEDGLPLFPSDATTVMARSQPQDRRTTVVFSYWHKIVNGRDNLGEETFEGLPAYRYRMTRTHDERSGRDVVNSDELYIELGLTTWKQYPSTEESLNLTKIDFDEPSPEWFEVPAGIRIAEQNLQGKPAGQ
jgi:hypothetical protein